MVYVSKTHCIVAQDVFEIPVSDELTGIMTYRKQCF